jgi:uncharacterized protein (UPF0332 family)
MNEHIQAILDKAGKSLAAAKSLLELGYLDFAVSRAYYTMFYTAEALLLSRGLSFSSHSAVIAAFGKEFSKSKDLDPKFHRHLIAVQDYRSIGDYDYGAGITAAQAQNSLNWASEFLQAAIDYIARM